MTKIFINRNIKDVDLSSLQDGDYLKYDSSSDKWITVDGLTEAEYKELSEWLDNVTLSGTGATYINTDSAVALVVENSGTYDNVLVVDTDNGRVGINKVPGYELDISGNVALPATNHNGRKGVIYKDGHRFIHDFSYGDNGTTTPTGNNIFVGKDSGNLSMGDTAAGSYQASNNVGVGSYALKNNTNGWYNMALGHASMYYNTTGNRCTGLGGASLYTNTTGTKLVGVGYNAGRYTSSSGSNQTSTDSVYLGADTKAKASGDVNEIVIGYGAVGEGSNTVVLGNTSITKTFLRGGTYLEEMTAPSTPPSNKAVIYLVDDGDGTQTLKIKFDDGTVVDIANN